MATIRLPRLSATYNVPSAPRARPVGPLTSAAASGRSGRPSATTVRAVTAGGVEGERLIVRRTTLPRLTMPVADPDRPFKVVVTNNRATFPSSSTVASQGPSRSAPDSAPTSVPSGRTTNRHPALAVASVPSVVGRLPTMIHPVFSITMAVSSPTPPGQPATVLGREANTDTAPAWFTSTIVVP